MDSTRIGSVLLTLALALPLAAGAVDLAPGAPERYTVKRGDTLWDIAGHYLREPWHWPKIWRANPQVRDPDRIYPGDVLTLEYVDVPLTPTWIPRAVSVSSALAVSATLRPLLVNMICSRPIWVSCTLLTPTQV